MDEKRILLVTHNDFPFGGACANFLRYLALGYAENGFNVDVLLQRGRTFGDFSRFTLPASIRFTFMAFTKRPSSVLLKVIDTLTGTIRPALHILFSRKEKYSLLYIYNRSGFELLPVTIAAKLRGVPVCNIVVEWYEKENLVRKKIHIVRWWDFLIRMKYLNKYFDSLLVLTHYLRTYYLSEGYPAERIVLIPNLVDMEIDLSRTAEMAARFPRRAETRIGYCGSPTRKDGIEDLLAAFQILLSKGENVELFIIGDLPGELSVLPSLKQKAAEMQISDSIIFTGFVPFNEVAPMLNTCDVLVLARPSGIFAEAGFPTKLGEYFACRKPVVLTKVGDFPAYFGNEESALLADADNPQSVAEKLQLIVHSGELRATLSERGYSWGSENLDYRYNTKKLIRFFSGRSGVRN